MILQGWLVSRLATLAPHRLVSARELPSLLPARYCRRSDIHALQHLAIYGHVEVGRDA